MTGTRVEHRRARRGWGVLLTALIAAGAVACDEKRRTETDAVEPAPGKAEQQHRDRNQLRITIVYGNNPYDERLETAWGFACVVEGLEKTILFDTGGRSKLLLTNMGKLGLSSEHVDAVVISHRHFDHVGGLAGFLERNSDVTVYVPKALPARDKRTVTKAGAKLAEVVGPVRICRHAYSAGQIGQDIPEQSLVLEAAEGLVVITGCAHPGVVKIVKAAWRQMNERVHLVLGGFHLIGVSDERLRQIAAELKAISVARVAPSHCSGDTARKVFKEAYGENYVRAGVGRRVHVALQAEPGVGLYTGRGAVRARDVAAALKQLNVPCREVNERDVRQGKLTDCRILIMPGGRTPQMLDALGPEGLRRIRQFVRDGGRYVGICAGAYLAAETVEVPGRPAGLGIIDIENRRRAGEGLRTLHLPGTDDTLLAGCQKTMRIWYKNGPVIEPGKGVTTLATYAGGGAAIVRAKCGKGEVVIFSPHPEGSLDPRADPGKLGTLKLLANAVRFER